MTTKKLHLVLQMLKQFEIKTVISRYCFILGNKPGCFDNQGFRTCFFLQFTKC